MQIFCIEDFKDNIRKLTSKKSYRNIEEDIIEYFFNSEDIQDLRSGTNLNQCNDRPYIKKRLKGSGGYRIYYLLILIDNNVYLMFIHPKTGSVGMDNLSKKTINDLYRKVYDCIKSNDLYLVEPSSDKKRLIFTKV